MRKTKPRTDSKHWRHHLGRRRWWRVWWLTGQNNGLVGSTLPAGAMMVLEGWSGAAAVVERLCAFFRPKMVENKIKWWKQRGETVTKREKEEGDAALIGEGDRERGLVAGLFWGWERNVEKEERGAREGRCCVGEWWRPASFGGSFRRKRERRWRERSVSCLVGETTQQWSEKEEDKGGRSVRPFLVEVAEARRKVGSTRFCRRRWSRREKERYGVWLLLLQRGKVGVPFFFLLKAKWEGISGVLGWVPEE